MKINSELLKEAIADAKAVRATALANAKAALEESFQKRFEAVFADKLQQEASEEQEEGMDEVSAPNQVSGKGGEAKGPKTKDVTKGQPKKGSTAKKDFKTIAIGGSEGAAGSKAPAAKQSIVNEEEEEEEGKEEMDETYEEEEEGKMDETYEEEEEGKMDEAGLTSEDLDEIIKELEMEVSDDAEGEEVPTGGEEMPPMAGGEEPEMGAGEPDGDEGGMPPEMGHAEPDGDEAGMPPEFGGGEEGGEEMPPMAGGEEGGLPPEATPKGLPDEEEINLEELIAALNEEEDEEEEGKEEMDEITNEGVPTNVNGQDKSGGVKGYPTAPQDASKKQLKGKNHNISGAGRIGTGAVGGKPMQEITKLENALTESYQTIEFLRGQINEVNLLNAKLLYTNKLFKEFSTNLDDAYRMKIVEAFDLTKSVREVKLAYALLAESLNFGAKGMKKTVVPVKKATPLTSVKQITEGMASRPVASTKPSKVITEGVSEMAERFKKLAGIKAVIVENKTKK